MYYFVKDTLVKYSLNVFQIKCFDFITVKKYSIIIGQSLTLIYLI